MDMYNKYIFMISLVELLKEVLNKPKAIFLAGPAGSGKTTIINNFLPSSDFKIINVDDEYETLLKKSGLGVNIKDFGPEELSLAAKMMGQAQKLTKEKYQKLKDSLKPIIIDGTGAASRPLLQKKKELEDLGYETFMVALYVSPITALERNISRPRSLPPGIVLRTWRDYNKNIEGYRQNFGNNFTIINTDDNPIPTIYDFDYIKKRFFDTAKGRGKPKSPEEIEKSKKQSQEINNDIKNLIKLSQVFDSKSEAKKKVVNFINR